MAGQPLGEYVKGRFYYGIKTGLNEAFVIDAATRDRLIAEDPKSDQLIKRYLRGRDVKRWQAEWAGLYLITFPFGFHEKLNDYPAILRHLTQYEHDLRKRGQCTSARNGKGEGQHHWLELDNNPKESYLADFELPKIILGRFMDKPTYAYDDGGYYANNALSIIAGADEFLVGILNSSLTWWYLTATCTDLQNGFIQVHNNNQETIVIPSASSVQRSIIGGVVKAVLKNAHVTRFEQLINGLVFELFFPDDLYQANIRLFDACEKAGIGKLADLKDAALATAASELADRIFATSHPIYAMLFDLQALEVVRIIEGKA
jgi:hypothetical protein